MAPNRGHNRARHFQDAHDVPPQDFDPEADDAHNHFDEDSEEDESADDDEHDTRDHYVSVVKSKLRNQKTPTLGPQYRGSRIARDAIDDDEDDEDDPFSGGCEDGEGDEGNDIGSVDDGSAIEDGTSSSNVSEDKAAPARSLTPAAERKRAEELKEAVRDQSAATHSLAQSIQAEAEKGRAVKKQKATFDSLLNARIKLQKALVGSNTLAGTPHGDLTAQVRMAKDALHGAEEAAFALWSSLNDLRDDMTAARTGEKRKRNSFRPSSSVGELWKHMQDQEEFSLPHRNVILQRWSGKAQGATAILEQGIINKSTEQPTIIDALQEQLSDRSRLLKRVHTPRSCAPLQVATGVSEDETIYDDADFYGVLLKELLEQKNADSIGAANVELRSGIDLRRATKAKKNVDTKASKGRKLRYTVHEKLQNFMAPEDRSTWSERQADELFGSLFGQRMGLGETRDDELVDDDDIGDGDAGLMLFRR